MDPIILALQLKTNLWYDRLSYISICNLIMLNIENPFVNQDFHTQQGKWQQCFDKPLPDTPSIEQLTENNKAFTVDDIVKFVEESGNLARRFRWFETYAANSNFYLLVAKPLLSMGIVGSMEVERRVKPLKDSILSKKRNRLSDSKAVALWRASENLKHIMQAKKVLGKSITDSKPVQL